VRFSELRKRGVSPELAGLHGGQQTDLKTLRTEAKAWNRRMNRDRVKIAWKFDRKMTRTKFRYSCKLFKRSEP